MTQDFLQDAIADDLRGLFAHYTLTNSLGAAQAVRVVTQDLPVRAGRDETDNADDLPEPYIIVRLSEGELPQEDDRQTVELALIVCVCDRDTDRQGYRDTLHIVNEIMRHYAANGIIAKRYEVQYPIRWATQEEDTHPYYFAAVGLKVYAPAIFKEVPET